MWDGEKRQFGQADQAGVFYLLCSLKII